MSRPEAAGPKKAPHRVAAGAAARDPDVRLRTMPADHTPRRRSLQALQSLFALLILGVLAAGLAGCSTGDFVRTREPALNDDMHRWEGAEVTGSVGRPASDFQLTDSERTLRDLAYFYIEPPHSRPFWKGVFGDYEPIPSPWRQPPHFDPTVYGRRLIDEPHRSDASRYSQLIDDVRNDTIRLQPFSAVALRVADYDQKRNASLKYIADLSPRERTDALARMNENAMIVQWAAQCVQQRIASYHWALGRLVIHAPDSMAAEADRLITDLTVRSATAIRSTPIVGQVLTVKG
jgi:hypothetical protein